ncbi:MAG: GerMN domain-containing protein [Peptococcaceae bacterium]|nr:GerMN domain-containing protein [Peptococcaceae bacterium]
MRRRGLLLTFLIYLVIIVALVGCNALDSVLKDGSSKGPLAQILDRTQNNYTDDISDATPVIAEQQQGESTIKLYFADKEGRYLIEINRTIPRTLSLAKETVCQWLMGPRGEMADIYPAVDPRTALRSINIKNGVAIVDLSGEFLQPYSNVHPETTLYGLVNTLCQFPTVEIVKIRIEGHDINTYQGISLDNLRFRADLIGGSTGPGVEQPEPEPEPGTKSPSSINLFD